MARNEISLSGEKLAKRPVGNPALTGADLDTSGTDKFLETTLRVGALPRIDWHNADQVHSRLAEYFAIMQEVNQKPTVTGMAIALGMSRKTLWHLVNDIPTGRGFDGQDPKCIPPECVDSIKRAYEFLAELMENYMENGKINPVSGIFLSKNHFGYVDKQEVVVTPKVAEDFSLEDIQTRYVEGD